VKQGLRCIAFQVVLLAALVALPRAVAAEAETIGAESARRGDAYFHLMKARMAAGRGRGNEALHEIQEATELEPKSASLHAEAAGLLAQIGRRDDAERLARKALELAPKEPIALRTLADLAAARALGSGRDPEARAEAIRLYRQLIETGDPEPQVCHVLTNLELTGGNLPGAIEMARKYAERRPADAGAAKLLTQLLIQNGQRAEALAQAVKFVASNPSSWDLQMAVSELATRSEDWKAVEEALAREIKPGGGGAAARAVLGEALLRQGRVAESVPVLEAATTAGREGRSHDAVVQALLGEAYLRLGRGAEAVENLEKALAAGPPDPMTRLHLASAYGELGRLADASVTAKSLAGDYPGNPAILIVLGEALSRQGLVDPAVEAFHAALDGMGGRDDDDAERRDDLRLRIAVLHLADEDAESAGRVLAALENKERAEALEVRARQALAAGKPKDVRALARKLRARGEAGSAALLEAEASLREGEVGRAEPRLAEAIELMGSTGREQAALVAREAGHPDVAEKTLRDWVRIAPNEAASRFALGRFLERTGRFPEAEAELRQVVTLEPKNAEALNYLGYSLADRDLKLDEAADLIERALALEPWNGAFLDSLGWARFQAGEFEKAREPLERAAREFPRDATVLEHLGDLYEQLGEATKAEAAWQQALDAEPDNAEMLRSKLAKLRSGGRERTEKVSPPARPMEMPQPLR
jgi:tetratricopeptide (TPR) repeat protein